MSSAFDVLESWAAGPIFTEYTGREFPFLCPSPSKHVTERHFSRTQRNSLNPPHPATVSFERDCGLSVQLKGEACVAHVALVGVDSVLLN